MSFHFADPRPARRPSLTPMIDVVFLLLVFFMLAARFGQDGAIPVTLAAAGDGYSGPPRLIDVGPETLALNGRPLDLPGVLDALPQLMSSTEDVIVLRGTEDANLQRLVEVMQALSAAGFETLVLVE